MQINYEDRTVANKILKLLRKAESTTHDAEADAFESKARELMEEYSIARGDLSKAKYEIKRTEDRRGYMRAPPWYKHLHFSIAKFLGVYHVYHRSTGRVARWTWAGLPRDIEMARYMVDAIVEQVEEHTRHWKTRRREAREEINSQISDLRDRLTDVEMALGDLREKDPAQVDLSEYDRLRTKLSDMYDHLESLKQQKKQLRTGHKQTEAFRVGLMSRLNERLHAMVDEVSGGRAQKALVKASEQEQKYEEGRELYLEIVGQEPSDTDPAKYSDPEALKSGYEKGEEIQVHKGTRSADESRQLTT